MAFPFTRYATFIAQNTPKVTAVFLNLLQDYLAAAAYPSYNRIQYNAYSGDQTNVVFTYIGPYMALDAATSQYVGMPAANSVTVNSGTSNAWNYLYVKVTNSVPAYSMSTTAPEATLTYKAGDATSRYLCAVYYYGSAVRRFTAKNGRYQFNDKVLLIGGDTAWGGYAASWTTINLTGSTSLPSTMTSIHIQASAVCGSGSVTQVWFRGSYSSSDLSSTGSMSLLLDYAGNVSYPSQADDDFEFATGSYFQFQPSTTSVNVRAMLRGFTE